jgi:hypothetical protein
VRRCAFRRATDRGNSDEAGELVLAGQDELCPTSREHIGGSRLIVVGCLDFVGRYGRRLPVRDFVTLISPPRRA